MSRKYFRQSEEDTVADPNQSVEDEDTTPLRLLTVIIGAAFILGLVISVRAGINLSKDKRLYESANVTKGVLIERVRIPNRRMPPTYYLRYRFKIPDGKQICNLDRETKTTPDYVQCLFTVSRIQVSEEVYKAAVIPSDIDVLYQSSFQGMWSEPAEYNSRTRRLGHFIFMCLLTSLFGGFTWKSLKTFKGKNRV